jgi:hypothetical protein
MPFDHVRSSYQPVQLAKLTEAFDLVWPEVRPDVATGDQLDQLRHRLANFLVACASRGEFEPERLRSTALRAFAKKVCRIHP